MNLDGVDTRIVVKAIDRYFKVSEVTFDQLPEELFKWELGGLGDPLGQLINWLWEQIQGALSVLEDSLKGIINSVKDTITSWIDWAKDAIMGAIDSVESWVTSVYNLLSDTYSYVSTRFSWVLDSLSDIGSSLTSVFSYVSSIWNRLISLGSDISSFFSTAFSKFGEITSKIGEVWDKLVSLGSDIGKFFSDVFNKFGEVLSKVGQIISEMGKRVREVVSPLIDGLRNWIAGTIQGISSTLAGVSTFLRGFFDSVVNRFRELGGIVISKFEWLRDLLAKAFSDALNKARGWIEEATKRLQDLGAVFQGFVNGVLNIWNWLTTSAQNFIDNAVKLFTEGIPAFFNWIYQNVKAFIDAAVNFFTVDVPKFFTEYLPARIMEFGKAITEGLSAAWNAFYNMVIKPVQDWLWTNIGKPLSDFFSNAVKFFTEDIPGFFNWVYENVKAFIDNTIKLFTEGIPAFFDWIYKNVKNFIDSAIKFFTETLPSWLADFSKYVIEFFKDPVGHITRALTEAWSGFYKTVIEPIKDWLWENVGKPISDALAPVADVFKPIGDFFTKTLPEWGSKIADFFAHPVDYLKSFGEAIVEAGKTVLSTIWSALQTLWGWIQEAAKWAWNALVGLGKALFGVAQSVAQALMEFGKTAADAITQAFLALYSATWGNAAKALKEQIASIITEKSKTGMGGEIEIFINLLPTMAPFLFGPRALAGVLLGIADTMREVVISVDPLGIGLQVPIKPGAILGEIAKAVGEGGTIIAHAIAYGAGIWFFQPMAKGLNAAFRNFYPVEIPTLAQMTQLTRRCYATPDFRRFREYMAEYMALSGYSDDVIYWITGIDYGGQARRKTPPPVKVKNRFGEDVEIPIPLIFSLPTPSDFARMMVHDIFKDYSNFETAMKMHGFTPSLAKLYYLLHFRYPSAENLWLFYTRAKAGLLWYEPVKKVDPNKFLNKALPSYMKWHDYYPQSWFGDDTVAPPDNAIMIELMADIPTRIDVRWMYKWGIVDEEFVRKIVTARGMHPNYVDDIAVAEMMNALAEERTYARTGVIELVREGLLTIKDARARLSNLATLKLLGKDVTVKFLPGEVELLLIRASADIERENARRKIERLRNLYVVGEIDDATLEKELKAIIRNPTVLETTLTQIKARKVRDQLYYTHRQLLRTIDAICSLYEDGFITKDKAEAEIKAVSGTLLTDKQIQLILKESEFRIRRTKFREIINKLRRGAITVDEARNALMKEFGLSEELANSIIEAHGRTYTLSISTLLAYADVVEVPEDLLTNKLDAMGVPEDEQEIILEVFKVRPIRNELSREISAAITDFVDGYMTEDALRNMLSECFKKEEEINILVTAAKIRRENKVKDYQIQAILARLRRGEIGVSEARAELQKIIVVPELVDALIGRTVGEIVKEYTLSISTLLSYATIIEISEDFLKARMQKLNIPPEDQNIILEVFRIRPIRDELARQVRAILDDFEEGYIDEKTARAQLAECYKKPREIDILIETAKIEKEAQKKKLKIDATLNKLKRGAITLDQARAELSKLIADKELVELIIEKNARIYTISLSTLASMKEYIPIPDDFLKKKMEALGVPEDEQKYWIPYIAARELASELGRYVTEIGNLYVAGKMTEQEFKKELDNVATLWGRAKTLWGVDWIVYSPEERQILFEVYKRRKERKAE